MSFFNKFLPNAVTDFVRRIATPSSSFTVQDVDANQLSKYTEVIREELFALYKQDATTFLAAVRYPPSSPRAFIIFQGQTEVAARNAFMVLSFKLQVMIHSCADSGVIMMNRDTLQQFSDALMQHPSWGCAHLAAKLKLVSCFRTDSIAQSINEDDKESGVTPILVALETGDVDCIKELIIRGALLDVVDNLGQNVFHYAVKTHNETVIQILASKEKAVINNFNTVGETALHDACIADEPRCIEQLLRWGANPKLTASARYPIHCAAKYGADDKSINQLCRWAPEQVHLKDRKYGGTPLHWAEKKECAFALCDLGCSVDAKSDTGETALHIMVRNNRYDCAMGLVIRGADAAAIDNKGDSALYKAVEVGNADLVQLMIVFGADVNQRNLAGATPRHLASTRGDDNQAYILYLLHRVGAQRCDSLSGANFPTLTGCGEGCSARGSFSGTPKSNAEPTTPENSKYRLSISKSMTDVAMAAALTRSTSASGPSIMDGEGASNSSELPKGVAGDRLLALDGGGVRGLILMQILLAIEKAVGQPIRNCFDWIGGSSTGAILALSIVHGKSVRYCLGMYFALKDKVFVGKRPYPSEPLEEFLKKELGETTRMDEVEYPRVIVTAVLADRMPAEMHLFRNYTIPGEDREPKRVVEKKGKLEFIPTKKPNDQLVWMAARASGAAPTYFRASGRFLDGGLMANNPTLDVITEVHVYNTALKSIGKAELARPIHVVVSVGTGCLPMRQVEACDVYRPEGIFDLAKVAIGAKNLVQHLVDQATNSDGRVVERGAAWCSMIGVPFYRFSPQLSEDIGLDCNDDRQLVNMLWETQVYISENMNRIRELATLLWP